MRIRLPKHRGARIGVLTMASVFLIAVYLRMITELAQRAGPNNSDADILWDILVWAQFVFVLFAAPAYASNAFSREKEQQTWDLLLMTPLTASEIVFGKLLGRLTVFFLPIVIILPLEILIAFTLGYYANGLFFLTLYTSHLHLLFRLLKPLCIVAPQSHALCPDRILYRAYRGLKHRHRSVNGCSTCTIQHLSRHIKQHF